MTFTRALLTTLLLTSFSIPAQATIYLVATDPSSHWVGMAAISSGPLVSGGALSGEKGAGLVGWSGLASNVDREMDAQVFKMMKQSAPADHIEAYVAQRIQGLYSRYVFASEDGSIGFIFPETGCGTPNCGAMINPARQYLVIGGGLVPDVVPHTMALYAQIQAKTDLPFLCKLLLGLKAIVSVGGEIEKFNSAEIAIDGSKLENQEWYRIENSNLSEDGILSNLQRQIAKAGVHCEL